MFAVTAFVEIGSVPVNPFSGMVTLDARLATAGLLLDIVTTAPPKGAPTLNTTVTLDALPPTTVEGLVDIVDNVAGGGAACGVKLHTGDHGPGVPAEFTPRTRQKCATVARLLVAYVDAVTDASRTSGAVKALESSI